MWNKKNLQQLQDRGRIRGFSLPDQETRKGKSSAPNYKSKGLDYISWNMMYWCNEKCLQLETEFIFNPDRKWRFDFAIPSIKVAVEFEGGIFLKNSGHNTARHYTKDAEKYNSAAIQGWRVLRFTAKNYKNLLTELNKCL